MIILGYFQKIQNQNFEIGLPAADIDKTRRKKFVEIQIFLSNHLLENGKFRQKD